MYALKWLLPLVSVATAAPFAPFSDHESAALVPRNEHVLLQRMSRDVTNSWYRKKKADTSQKVLVTVYLKGSNLDKLEDELLDVSKPSSKNYGKFWSIDKTVDYFKPDYDQVKATKKWLHQHEIYAMESPTGLFLTANATIKQLSSMLGSTYYLYENNYDKDLQFVATPFVYVPHNIARFITAITPTVSLGQLKPLVPQQASLPDVPQSALAQSPTLCPYFMTGECVGQIYGMDFSKVRVNSNNSQLGFVDLTSNGIDTSSVNSFFKGLFNKDVSSRINVQDIASDSEKAVNTTLPDLAMDIALDIVGDSIVNSYEITQDNYLVSLFEHMYRTSAQEGSSKVIEIPYMEREFVMDPNQIQLECQLFGMLGLNGTTFVVPSGDKGASGVDSQENFGFVQQPYFPASCPYVLTVGSLALESSDITAPQTASVDTVSGGGFSNVFSQASFQKDSIGTWFSRQGRTMNGKTSSFNTSKTTRGYPDVSIVSDGFLSLVNGEGGLYSTSNNAASTVAALLAVINDRRISTGSHPVGYVNPAMYLSGISFYDITRGNNSYKGDGNGFQAIEGWDPVTGLGSFNFTNVFHELTQQWPI